MEKLNENAGLIERIHYYVDSDQHDKARALAKVGDYLEECFLWDLCFDGEASS